MLISLLVAQAVSTTDYPCWMENPNGRVIDMTFMCKPSGVEPGSSVQQPPPNVASEQQPPEQALNYLLQQAGRLEAGDEVALDGTLFDRYTFEGGAGQSVVITSDSQEFDTYLVLLDGSERVLAENDDRDSTSTNSIINFNLPADGVYSVIVNGVTTEDQGGYNLAVQSVNTP